MWTRGGRELVYRKGDSVMAVQFLLIKLAAERPQPRIAVVLNWFDELRAKVPR